jgi:hypothetical protein
MAVVNIGLDFGTSTFKIVAGIRNQGRVKYEQVTGLEEKPSTAYFANGEIHWREPASGVTAYFFEPKTMLLWSVREEYLKGLKDERLLQHARDSQQAVLADYERTKVRAEWVILLMLGSAVSEAKEWAVRNGHEIQSWQAALPLTDLDANFDAFARLAILLDFSVRRHTEFKTGRLSVAELEKFSNESLADVGRVKKNENGGVAVGSVAVLPEALGIAAAAIKLDLANQNGFYVVCDVGAQTTDAVWLLRTSEDGAERDITFFPVYSGFVAGNDFRDDLALAKGVDIRNAEGLLKEQRTTENFPNVEDLLNALEKPRSRALGNTRSKLGAGWAKKISSRIVAVIVAGGGARIPGVTQKLGSKLGSSNTGTEIKLPVTRSFERALSRHGLTEFQALACGLARSPAEMPSFWGSEQLEDDETTAKVSTEVERAAHERDDR